MLVAAYARASTSLHEDAVPEQLATIREYCAREGHTVVEEYCDDGVSGGLPLSDRPAAQRMLADAKAKRFEAIVCKQLDRLGRNAADLIAFAAKGNKLRIPVLFTKEEYEDSPQGRMMYGMMALFAEYYRADIGQKILHHNRYVIQSGRWVCGEPSLGYLYDKATKSLAVDPDRAGDALMVFQTFVECIGNFSATARTLNMMGIRTLRGHLWEPCAVARVLRAKIYRGVLAYQELRVPLDIRRIIPDSLLAQVDAKLAPLGGTTRGASNRYPYSKLMKCAHCGYSYVVGKGDKTHFEMWYCNGKTRGACKAKGVSSNFIDRAVSRALGELIAPIRKEIVGRKKKSAEPVVHVDRRRAQMEAAKKRVVDAFVSGVISKEDMEKRAAEIDAKLAESDPPKRKGMHETLAHLLGNAGGLYLKLTNTEKRTLLMLLESQITIDTTARKLHLSTTLGDTWADF